MEETLWIGAILTRQPVFGGQRPPLQLFADNHDENFSVMWRAAMFEEKNALPCAKLQYSRFDDHLDG